MLWLRSSGLGPDVQKLVLGPENLEGPHLQQTPHLSTQTCNERHIVSSKKFAPTVWYASHIYVTGAMKGPEQIKQAQEVWVSLHVASPGQQEGGAWAPFDARLLSICLPTESLLTHASVQHNLLSVALNVVHAILFFIILGVA